jgi:DNA/RNA non-specific endonuclease
LQAVVGCAGAAAGSGNCGSAAIGAAASVVLVNVLTGKNPPADKDFDGIVDSPSLEQQQALTNIVTTLIAGTAGAAGIDVPAAVLAAQIEIENNSNCAVVDCQRTVAQIIRRDGMTLKEMKVKDPQAYQEIIERFGSPERAEAYLVGRDQLAVLADKQKNQTITAEETALYQATLKMAGGNFETAQNILGLQHYYATQGTLNSPTGNPTFENASIVDVARFYAAFGKGTAKGAIDDVVDGAKDIAGVLSDPQKAWEDAKKTATFIWENPEKFVELLGAEGQKYVDDVKSASILYEAALLSGDADAQSKSAEQLGNLVGAPLALAVGTAGLGTAVKALKIGDKIIELIPGKKVPEVNVFKIEAGKATKGTPEFALLNNPPPNSRIELDNGNIYVTNAHGLVEEVTFHPRLVKEVRDSRQTEVGKQGLDTDVGGHIQACSLGGTCDKVNLFPQDANFNNKEYKTFENEIRRALVAGEDVGAVKVIFKRSNPNDVRPTELSVEYTIGGRKTIERFKNENGGGL